MNEWKDYKGKSRQYKAGEWRPDINKLKNYKIEESKFENPEIEEFTNCVFSAKNDEDVDTCRFYLPPKYKIESGGDMRCSGKSEILHLMFPILREITEFSGEEETSSFPISSKLKNFTEPDINKMVIYVKRNPEEKLKCLLKYRSIFRDDINREPTYHDLLPNDLKNEAYSKTEHMRKTMLPSIYQHKNFMIVENKNKEEDPIITKDKICNISKKQLENIKLSIKRDLEYDKTLIEEGVSPTEVKENYESSTKGTEERLKYIEEYKNTCNTSADINEIKKIMKERKKIITR